MTRFIGEKIEVRKAETSPRPTSFTWRDRDYAVAEVVREWVDTGYGSMPPASRTWYNRRHRRYYVVRTPEGELFKLYFDYADRKHPTWWLVEEES
jgi:hypothetical protein